MLKKLIKGIFGLILTGGLIFGGYLGFLTLTDLNHEPIESLTIESNRAVTLDHTKEISLTTFNIGFAGLDAGQDFFADGGKAGRSKSLEQTEENLASITEFLKTNDSDFVFIQEVDTKALRTYKVNEYDWINQELNNYGSVYANNYHAQWVPLPIMKPMGYVDAGMMTLSKFQVETANRHALKGQESWPMKLMELDRCFIETEIKCDDGKSLFLMNLHLSAYDEGGVLRSQQVQHLITVMTERYEAGHYVVLGGDWNQLLSSVQESDPEFMASWPAWLVNVSDELTAGGFKWAVDDTTMTVRDLVTPYVEGETFVTIIDGFLMSPNVDITSVKAHDLKFENSDHNPVTVTFKLK